MLSNIQVKKIKTQVKQAATAHLNAKDADTALSRYTKDVLAVSNTHLFDSRKPLSVAVREHYGVRKKVKLARWKDVHIFVINRKLAIFTAKFIYKFVDSKNILTDLRGVWTALFILERGIWKIQLRHESFEQA